MRHLLFAFFTLQLTVSNAWAWGDTGHRVVCEIALRLAKPETRAEIGRLIQLDPGFEDFRDSCIWPDHPRKRDIDHFVNLPRTASGIVPNELCALANSCVLTAIDKDLAVLSAPSSSDPDKIKSLKFLSHWVGDIHQPMHVSFKDDRGGNDIRVSGECRTNMHSAWDTCLLQIAIGPELFDAIDNLMSTITPAKISDWTATSPIDWANESFAITTAPTTKYCVRNGPSCDRPTGTVVIGTEYVQANAPILRERLQKAGVRLGHLLDKALR
jgi:nuclease S1